MNLTLIIPTKNRFKILKKTIDFYSKNIILFKIIILDSSDNNQVKIAKKYFSKKKNIKHIALKGWSTEVIRASKKFVDTKYVAFSGDDDFLCINNLKFFINFLDSQNEYQGVMGLSIVANVTNYKLNYTSGYKFNEITSNKPYDRLIEFFDNYSTLMFAISRKKTFFSSMYLLPKKRPKPLCSDMGVYTEIIPCAGLAYYGRYKVLDIPYLVRVVGHERVVLPKKIDSVSIKYLISIFERKIYKNIASKKLLKQIINKILYKYKFQKKIYKFDFKNFVKNILDFFHIKKFILSLYKFLIIKKFSVKFIMRNKQEEFNDFKLILRYLSEKYDKQ